MGLVHLIRHGQAVVSGVLLGRLDPPLLELPGKSDLAVATVLSSPLRRARETAEALFPEHCIEVVEELVEISLGEWDGLAWADVERRDPELAQRKLTNWFGVTPPGGEEPEAVSLRASRALDIVRAASAPVAIVAHAGINAVLWNLLTGSPSITFRQAYLEVKTLEVKTHDRAD